jgi:hypothetical protein
MDREFSSPFRDYGGNVYRRWYSKLETTSP